MKGIKRKTMKKIKKGGCGCSGNTDVPTPLQPVRLISGGKRKSKKSRKSKRKSGGGYLGPASLTNYDPSNAYTYSKNILNNDPQSPSEIINSRQLPNNSFFSGGRKKRRMKGGADPYLQTYNTNSISNFALTSSAGALTGADIITGNPIQANTYQPLDTNKPFL
jgi:hypothetical protein